MISPLKKIIKTVGIVLGTIALMVVVYYGEKSGEWLKANLLNPPAPWDGTTLPLQKVPNWSQSTVNRDTGLFGDYSSRNLINLPAYDLSILQFPDDKLEWDNRNHDYIRNAKITYPVVYMGSYDLNHTEFTGSHLAVDIKVPTGTPVYAIANGRVIKSSLEESGFGHHVVLMHPDAPDPDNPGKQTTLYSVYAHMSDVTAVEGTNVLKGTVIGKSGETGTATSPHLHFQIDKQSAPWHPYWPFTWSEAQQAGLSFFEAVNAGLGRDNGTLHTINPLPYVYQHLKATYLAQTGNQSSPPLVTSTDEGAGADSAPADETESSPPAPEVGQNGAAEIPLPVNPNIVVEETSATDLLEFKINGEHFGLIGNSLNVYVTDEKDQLEALSFEDAIRVRIQGNASSNTRVLHKDNFKNGVARLTVHSSTLGSSVVSVGKTQHEVHFIESANPPAGFKIKHDGAYIKNLPETITIQAIDSNNRPTPIYSFEGVIELKAKTGQARFEPAQLERRHFKEGMAQVTMTGLGTESIIIRAQNGALLGESEMSRNEAGQLFTDIAPSHEQFSAIKFLKEQDIVSGYPDGSFKPERTVNRVEALKMLMLAFAVKPVDEQQVVFKDTKRSDWYTSYLTAAVHSGIVTGYGDGTFRPAQTVNRAEYLKVLFRTNHMDANAPQVKPFEDVPKEAWFAPYAFLASKKNILPEKSETLEPQEGVTRAEVAETIYRMKMIQKNNWITYSGQ